MLSFPISQSGAMLSCYCFVAVALSVITGTAQVTQSVFGFEKPEENFISNWDLEETINGVDISLSNCRGKRVALPFTGSYSYEVSDRSSIDSSLVFRANSANSSRRMKEKRNYFVSVFIRLANDPINQTYVTVILAARVSLLSGATRQYYISTLPYLRSNQLWQLLGGDFKTPAQRFRTTEFYIITDPANVNYYIDTLSLTELDDLSTNWRQMTSSNIDRIRKSDIKLNVDVGEGCSTENVTVELIQQTHDFKFGASLKPDHFISRRGALYKNYRDFFLKHFKWTSLDKGFNWRSMEFSHKGAVRFRNLDKALRILGRNNVSVRASAVVGGSKQFNPKWLSDYHGKKLLNEIYRRVNYVVKHFRNKVAEWDVYNAYLHFHDYETETGEDELLCKLFKMARNIDPNVKLCTNDFHIISRGWTTAAAFNLASELQKKNCGVNCFGTSSHLDLLPADAEVLQKRLQIACSTGLPVSITELSIRTKNVTLRAEELDKALHIFFSQQCVQSVMLYGLSNYWPLRYKPHTAITKGIKLKLNEAGRRLIRLVSEVWNSTTKLRLEEASSRGAIRAFHGFYKLVLAAGNKIHHQTTVHIQNGFTTTINVVIQNCSSERGPKGYIEVYQGETSTVY